MREVDPKYISGHYIEFDVQNNGKINKLLCLTNSAQLTPITANDLLFDAIYPTDLKELIFLLENQFSGVSFVSPRFRTFATPKQAHLWQLFGEIERTDKDAIFNGYLFSMIHPESPHLLNLNDEQIVQGLPLELLNSQVAEPMIANSFRGNSFDVVTMEPAYSKNGIDSISNDDLNQLLMESYALQVSPEKEPETPAKKDEEYFKFITRNVSNLILHIDAELNILYSNETDSSHINNEIAGYSLMGFIHPEDQQRFERKVQQVLESGTPTTMEHRVVNEDNEYVWYETHLAPHDEIDGNFTSLILTCNNIHKQKLILEMERDVYEELQESFETNLVQLHENEEKFRLISENMTDLVCLHDMDGTITFATASAIELLGRSPEALTDQALSAFCIPKYSELIENVFLSLKEDPDGIHKIEYQLRQFNGSHKWVESIFKPVFSPNGDEMMQVQSTTRDITCYKRAQRESRNLLEKARNLSELRSQFVSTASHQFRTPLTIIQSNMDLMSEVLGHSGLSDDSKQSLNKMSERITNEVNRMTDLMDEILILCQINGRNLKRNTAEADLLTCTQAIINRLNEAHHDIDDIELKIEGKQQELLIDEKHFHHSLNNLISNAIKYSDGKPVPEVTISYGKREVQIEIRDHGIGIPEDELEMLFQPFFRASNTRKIPGTGLGLLITKEYLELIGGTISCESTQGVGSCFKLNIPLTKNEKEDG